MPGNAYIPVEVIKKDLVEIDARLAELKQEVARLHDEEGRLVFKRSVLADLAGKAIRTVVKAKPVTTPARPLQSSELQNVPHPQAVAKADIPDGRVATPIIYQMLRERPGIKSVEVIEALSPRVTKRGKSPRKFLGDLIYELRHRNKIRREADGSLFLTEQGGTHD